MTLVQTIDPRRFVHLVAMGIAAFVLLCAQAASADISRFIGDYTGSAEIVSADGSTAKRDMSVRIQSNKYGFSVQWTSATHKPDGRIKEKSFSINFVPSQRAGIYAAAMQRNVFGHEVPLDPMKGEPFVWARIEADTLSVFSLFVDDVGGYELQQFDRTLTEGGLMLKFTNLRNGEKQRSVSTFLQRQ